MEILGEIEGFLGDEGRALRVGRIIRQQGTISFHFDATPGSCHDQSLRTAFKFRPPGIDILPRQRLRLSAAPRCKGSARSTRPGQGRSPRAFSTRAVALGVRHGNPFHAAGEEQHAPRRGSRGDRGPPGPKRAEGAANDSRNRAGISGRRRCPRR